MTPLSRRNGHLHFEEVALTALAERHGTPLYVYSAGAIEARYRAFAAAFRSHPHRVCYAVKANSNLAVLQLLAQLGAGFDIVSGGELERVLLAGGDPAGIVFSGVGKTVAEMERALEVGVACFNVESKAELLRLEAVAKRLGVVAPVSLRVNPDVDAATHPYISTGLKENKFGVSISDAAALYRYAADAQALAVTGVDCHIGSQLTTLEPFVDALDRVLALVEALNRDGIELAHIDLGGGLGVRYQDETPPGIDAYATAILERLGHRREALMFEPGRWLVGEAGVFLTRVEYVKENEGRHFLVVDGAMNDLLRPALYGSFHGIEPVFDRPGTPAVEVDVVGPVCESSDFLGKNRMLAAAAGDLLAVTTAGAYGFGMASNYNSRNRAAEVLVRGEQDFLVRRRETTADQLAFEQLLPPLPVSD
ncbi:MAG: diaminopimelate decarboxylase [Gammaproteobacteria bacterium]|nr:diaminopimelate decarboxylase [Gammaproteobacteria bacterium]